MNIFEKILSKLFGWLKSDKAKAVLSEIEKYSQEAMPIVELVAAGIGKPGIIDFVAKAEAFYAKYDLEAETFLNLTSAQQGAVLLDTATKLLQKQAPSMKWSTLMSAAQLAYSLFSAGEQTTTPAAQ